MAPLNAELRQDAERFGQRIEEGLNDSVKAGTLKPAERKKLAQKFRQHITAIKRLTDEWWKMEKQSLEPKGGNA